LSHDYGDPNLAPTAQGQRRGRAIFDLEDMMRTVFLYMTTTLDGFVAGPNNELDWMVPTPEPELTDDIVALLSRADSGFVGYPVATEMVPYWRAAAQDPRPQKAAVPLPTP